MLDEEPMDTILVSIRLRQVNLSYPASDWGAAESGRDREKTRHLHRLD